MTRFILCFCLGFSLGGEAATSPNASASPLGGNGHNVSFDGRLFVVRRNAGWEAVLLRPQGVVLTAGFPSVANAFSSSPLVQPEVNTENALALCEETPQPTRCNADGSANVNGSHACYDEVVIDSDALAAAPANVLRKRRLKVVVSNPGAANADISSFTWLSSTLTPLQPTLRGIEPTISKDGKLMVWQGVPTNTGSIDTLVYSYNPVGCATTGWTLPKSISAMYADANLVGTYKLAERPLRGADGVAFANNALFYGAYPWLFPSGEAINFTAVNMPCRSGPPNEDPPGCGPRRSAISVIGYPTNWQLAHVDGAVNPDTDQTVRLFFSSPGPTNVKPQLPATPGADVWPFFGSNTNNYTELVFDDALDGRYAGLWHFNELVNNVGAFDLTRTADTSGYSNTGKLLGGAGFPLKNNGALGKAIVLDGLSGRVEVAHAASLNPVNAITIELQLKPGADPNCDGNNNYRNLLNKGASYQLVFEEPMGLRGRLRVTGGVIYDLYSVVPAVLGQWSHAALQYDAATGTMAWRINGVETARVTMPPALLEGTTDKLLIGAPGARALCPNGDGAFKGELDEVAISRIWRYGTPPTAPVVDAGVPDAGQPDAGTPVVDSGTPVVDSGTPVVDSGTPVVDSGTPVVDSGTPVVDSGTPVVDSGTPVVPDAGGAVGKPDGGSSGPAQEMVTVGGCSAAGGSLIPLALLLRLLRRRSRR